MSSPITNYYPIDPNNDPLPSFDFNSSTGTGLTPFGGNSDQQILYNLLSEMRSVNNNVMNIQAYMDALLHLSQNKGDVDDKSILQLLSHLQGPDPSNPANMINANTFFADQFALWSFGANNGDESKTVAQISSMIDHLGGVQAESNPIIGGLIKELEAQKNNIGALTQKYMVNGQLQIPIKNADGTTTLYMADQQHWAQYISGNVGSFFNGSNLKDQLKDFRLSMFDELANNPDANKYGAFALLAILISMLEINDDESQQSGVSNNTQFQSGITKEIAGINGNFNPQYFTGSSNADGEANSVKWVQSLNQITEELNLNSNASNVATAAKEPIDGILNTQVTLADGKTPGTLLALYNQTQTGSAADRSAASLHLSGVLNQLSSDPSKGITPTGTNQIVDNLSALSKALTSAGQTLSTQSNALSQSENSMENTLSQVLSALKKLLDAIMSGISQT